jgi:hypothetical protein
MRIRLSNTTTAVLLASTALAAPFTASGEEADGLG